MSQIRLSTKISATNESVYVVTGKVAYSEEDIRNKLLHLDQDVYALQADSAAGVCLAEDLIDKNSGTKMALLAHVMPMQVG
ncbi:MAG: 2-nitropropane dioxygenase, partial [SAR324 cluster bacterium]|nr:2-nitropropane dioxygenase [SAR324 cluster bacterium]